MTGVLAHHGILGQKWGIRRFQNPDGTLTPAGKKRYKKQETRKTEEGANKDTVRKAMKSNNAKRAALALSSVLVIPLSTVHPSLSNFDLKTFTGDIEFGGPVGLTRAAIAIGAYVFADAKLRSKNRELRGTLGGG